MIQKPTNFSNNNLLIPYFKLTTSQFNISNRSNPLVLSPYKTKHLTSLTYNNEKKTKGK